MSSGKSRDVERASEKDHLLGGNDGGGGKRTVEKVSFVADCVDTIKLGFPIFVAMVSWVGMKTTDSALLGHSGVKALSASALSDLWTMCTGVLIQGRVLGILVGAAVGAGNPKLAGVYLQVSYFVLFCISAFVFVAWSLTEQVWVAFGSDPTISKMAGYYSSVLALGIPAMVAFSQLSQFFSAQRILTPEVNTSAFAMLTNLTFGLIFVLGIPIPGFSGYGFTACPIVTTCTTYAQFAFMFFIYIYMGRKHEACWDGWAWQHVTRDRIRVFCELYFPAALGMASDFWRVGVIGAVAAKLGEVDVAVFNTGYRLMWVVLIMVNALSNAAGIKMSMRLGNMDAEGAKQAGHVGIAMSAAFLVVIFALVVSNVRTFGRVFTEDEEFLDLFEEVRWPFTVTLVLMNLAVGIEKVPYSMGRTTEVFWMGGIASWGAQVPGVLLLTRYWRNDLFGLYWGMTIGYAVLVCLYSYITFTADWKRYAELAQARSEA